MPLQYSKIIDEIESKNRPDNRRTFTVLGMRQNIWEVSLCLLLVQLKTGVHVIT